MLFIVRSPPGTHRRGDALLAWRTSTSTLSWERDPAPPPSPCPYSLHRRRSHHEGRAAATPLRDRFRLHRAPRLQMSELTPDPARSLGAAGGEPGEARPPGAGLTLAQHTPYRQPVAAPRPGLGEECTRRPGRLDLTAARRPRCLQVDALQASWTPGAPALCTDSVAAGGTI